MSVSGPPRHRHERRNLPAEPHAPAAPSSARPRSAVARGAALSLALLLLLSACTTTGSVGAGLPSGALMPLADPALPPPGYYQYCKDFHEQDGGCAVELTPARLGELRAVNRHVNRIIVATPDPIAFGVEDYWAPLPEGGPGDCDNYAITKLHALMARGWPRPALRLTVALVPREGHHLVLAVNTDRGVYILDNLVAEPVPWTRLAYDWLLQEVPGRPYWVTIARS